MIENKIAVITGASGGIGLACAQRFVKEGAKVVVSDVADEQGEKAVDELKNQGGDAIYVHCDVRSKQEIENLFDVAIQTFGRVDTAIANAGIVHASDVLELSEEDYDNVIAINLAYLIVGVVVVEVVFVYPGLGQLIVDSVAKRDIPVVQACCVIFAATYIILNLTADILSIVTNPRLLHPR